MNVNSIVFVEGGDSIGVTDFDGSISLNGITCQQWKINNGQGAPRTAWPLTHWDCVNPAGPGPESIAVASAAATQIFADRQLELGTKQVQIYTMTSAASWKHFFVRTNDLTEAHGASITETFEQSSTVFTITTHSGGSTTPNAFVVGTIGHELGHQLDFIWGNPSTHAGAGQWIQISDADLAKDVSFMDSPDGGATSRPCTEVFSQQTCNANPSLTNTQIFINKYNVDPSELFAGMFEHLQTNGQDSEFEHALDFFPAMEDYMAHAIFFGVHP